MTGRATLAASVALLAAACSDPAGPCEGTYACEVAGVDLAIVDARIVEGDRIGTDRVTGLPVYAAGPVSVAFTIVNRGDSTSLPQPFGITADELLQPLRPGESTQIVVTEDYSDALHIEYLMPSVPLDARVADRRTISTNLHQRPPGAGPDYPAAWPVHDADLSNNSSESPPFHVAIPVLRATIPNTPEIRASTPFVASFRVDNVSVHGADAGPFDVVLCAWDFDLGCYGEWWTFFGRFEVPRIEAGWKHENAYVTEVGPASMVWPAEAHTAWISLCIVPRDHDSPYLASPTDCLTGTSAPTRFRPNYEACSPPLLQPGAPLTLAGPNCATESPTRAFAVAAFDAVGGRTYTLDGPAVAVYDSNGDEAGLGGSGLTFRESGRYYVVYRQNRAITITLRE